MLVLSSITLRGYKRGRKVPPLDKANRYACVAVPVEFTRRLSTV